MCICIVPGGDSRLFYSNHNPDEKRLIGYVRFDFGQGHAFWHTWWANPVNGARNTYEFKQELSEVVNALRNGILKSVADAQEEVVRLKIPFLNNEKLYYGFYVETIKHSYYVRLYPYIGDYSYIYCYLSEEVYGQGVSCEMD